MIGPAPTASRRKVASVPASRMRSLRPWRSSRATMSAMVDRSRSSWAQSSVWLAPGVLARTLSTPNCTLVTFFGGLALPDGDMRLLHTPQPVAEVLPTLHHQTKGTTPGLGVIGY
jgi:hypothetical protein